MARTKSDNWFARSRLAFIERKANTSGTINLSDVTEQFEVSRSQASGDLQHYQQLNPGALTYDIIARTYRWNPKRKLKFPKAPWEELKLA